MAIHGCHQHVGAISLILLLLSVAVFAQAPSAEETIKECCGDMEFTYTYERGAVLRVFGIPVIVESSFWIVNPFWSEHYFGGDLQKDLIQTARVESWKKGKKITLTLRREEKNRFAVEGTQVFYLEPENVYSTELEFQFRWLRPETKPVIYEWNPAMLNAVLFAGQSFSPMYESGASPSIQIPRTACFDENSTNLLTPKGFSGMRMNSPLGEVNIQISKDISEIRFLDYRKSQWADAKRPVLWIGNPSQPLSGGRKYSHAISFQFPRQIAKRSKAIAASLPLDAVKPIGNALAPNWGRKYIIPTPKSLEYTEGDCAISTQSIVYLGSNPTTETLQALRFLLDELRDIYGVSPRVLAAPAPAREEAAIPQGSLLIGTPGGDELPARLCASAGLPLPKSDEGYVLMVNPRFAAVAGASPRGTFYGVATMIQLLKVNERGLFLQGAKISDYPALKFRGIHHFTGHEAGGQIARAIPTLMARYKINSFIFECQHLQWKSHPEVWSRERGMTIEEARQVAASARENFVEIIPLVQSFSHAQWMFENKQHLDLAENPDKPDAYMPENPKAMEMTLDAYKEALEIFRPRHFHIGHDEVFFSNRLDALNRDPAKFTDIFVKDTIAYYEWFKKRGIGMMMWSDILLYPDMGLDACNAPSPEEAKRRRDAIPKDVIITDWHYEQHAPERFVSLKLFQDAGFRAIGCSWFRPENIATFAEGCAYYGALGFLKTTWAGYNFQIDKNPDAWVQYGNNILAGQYAWTGKATRLEDLPFNFREVFQDVWRKRKPVWNDQPGGIVDLRSSCNRRLDDNAAGEGWLGQGADRDLSAFSVAQTSFGETRFHIRPNENGNAAVLFDGLFNPPGNYPSDLRIPIGGRRLSEIHFLITASYQTIQGAELGSAAIHYSDGTRHLVPLLYAENLFAWDDLRVANDSRVAWKGEMRAGTYAQMNDWRLENPFPQKAVDFIALHSAGRESAPVLFAITLVDSKR